MIKKHFILTIIIGISIILIFTGCSSNQNNSNNQTNLEEQININDQEQMEDEKPLYPGYFEKGEKISYKLMSFLGHVGNQTLGVLDITEYEGTKCYYLKSITSLIPEIEEQFNYDYEDIIYSYVDYKTLLPIKIIKDVQQGDYIDDIEINLDQENKTGMYISQRNHPEGIELSWEEDGLFYLLSVIYYMRAQDLQIGSEYVIHLLDEESFQPIDNSVVAVEGEPYKKVPTIELQQANPNASVNSISMRLIDNKGKNYLPVSITIGVMKLGDLTVNLEAVISSYIGGGENN